MFTLMTVIRKRPEVSTEAFRHFMEFDYGPTYVGLPQTLEYEQYYLTDTTSDDAEPPIDAVVKITFESPEHMHEALNSESYRRAHDLRTAFMRDTSVGIHAAIVDRIVKLV